MIEVSQPRIGRAFGNPEVVSLLETWLEAARKGSISYVAIAGLILPKTAIFNFTGSSEGEDSIPEVLDELKSEIEKRTRARLTPDHDEGLDASHVCYNGARQALSFDFMVWLVGAELERRLAGAPGPLKVGFWFGESGCLGLESTWRTTMFENVIRPSLPLLGAVEDPAAVRGRSRGYRLKEIVEASRAGHAVPKFRPSARAQAAVSSWFLSEERPIVITLREAESWPHRNSNVEAWLRFADYLMASGEMVIFVRDTAKATEQLPGYSTCPIASTDIDMRCALYQRAKTSVLVSNGPSSLLTFMDAPWLMLSQHDDASEYYPETSKWWEENGMTAGEQYPWNATNQREVFTKNRVAEVGLDEIMEAWRGYSSEL